jgi:hypothetical protein
MAASDITISSFSAVPGVGIVSLAAIASPPSGFEDLSYMQPAKIRFYRNTTNNSGTAALTGETTSGVLSYDTTATYYYFAAAVDPAGNEGARSSGVSCVPKVNVPDGSVTAPKIATGAVTETKIADAAISSAKIQDAAIYDAKIANASISSAKIVDLVADKIAAGTITASIEIVGPTITGGTIRTKSSGARIELKDSTNTITVIDSSGRTRFAAGPLQSASIIAQGYGGDTVINGSAMANTSGGYGVRGLNNASGGGNGVLGV